MAGAAYAPLMTLVAPRDVIPGGIIKTSEVINEGDLVGMDSNGLIVVATNATAGIIKAIGMAFFEDNNGTGGTRTGDGTLRCSIARKGKLKGATSTLVPSLGKGLPVYLTVVPTSTTSNYTCALTSNAGDAIIQVGFVEADGTTLDINVDPNAGIRYRTSTTISET